MKESDLLQYCRYYKGERENPYEGKDQNKMMLWLYERTWVHDTMAVIARGDVNASESRNLDEYTAVGLAEFENADGVPITLKSLLFNRYAQGNMSSMGLCRAVQEILQAILQVRERNRAPFVYLSCPIICR